MFFRKIGCLKTKKAYLGGMILRSPFWTLYNLLPCILYKDLGATPFQIALFIGLKPVASIFSVYWGNLVENRPERLKKNVLWASILGFAPFLLFPVLYHPYYIIFASSLFMVMNRGVIPAWMEMFKRNLPKESKHGVFSLGAMISYLAGAIFPLLIGNLLDFNPLCWRWLFPLVGLLGMSAIFLQNKLPQFSPKETIQKEPKSFLFSPWISALKTWKAYPNFRLYLFGFMLLGGSGIMILQPALPKYFIDVLSLNYKELGFAMSMCKGLGFVCTAPFWAKKMPKSNFYLFASSVVLLGIVFPLILLLAQKWIFAVYFAYVIYGILQAGSELTWHLAAPIFAKTNESAALSNLNILAVGVKGCIIPQIGTLLIYLACPIPAILCFGSLSCFVGMVFLMQIALRKRALVPG